MLRVCKRMLLIVLPFATGAVRLTKDGSGYVPFHFTDQTNAAAGFFNNMRTPAALLAGAALSNAFALQNIDTDQFNTKRWKRIRTAYVVLMTVTFSTELLTILLATSVSNRALGGGFDPMAESCIAMISREFPDSLVAVQFNFITGMISFVIGQSIRFFKELSVRPFTTYISRAAAWILGAAAFQMISFFNAEIVFVDGYPELAVAYSKILLQRAASGVVSASPAPILAVGCLAIALFYVVLSLLDADQDGTITAHDFGLMLKGITGNAYTVCEQTYGVVKAATCDVVQETSIQMRRAVTPNRVDKAS